VAYSPSRRAEISATDPREDDCEDWPSPRKKACPTMGGILLSGRCGFDPALARPPTTRLICLVTLIWLGGVAPRRLAKVQEKSPRDAGEDNVSCFRSAGLFVGHCCSPTRIRGDRRELSVPFVKGPLIADMVGGRWSSWWS